MLMFFNIRKEHAQNNENSIIEYNLTRYEKIS